MTVETTTFTAGAAQDVSFGRAVLYRGGFAQVGRWAVNYSLALIFLWFGCLKFTDFEASGIAPLIMNSPLVGWTHATFGIAGAAKAIGVVEIAVGLLIAVRALSPRASVVGGLLAAITFLIWPPTTTEPASPPPSISICCTGCGASSKAMWSPQRFAIERSGTRGLRASRCTSSACEIRSSRSVGK